MTATRRKQRMRQGWKRRVDGRLGWVAGLGGGGGELGLGGG